MANILGRRVSVYWPEEEEWFDGEITAQGLPPAENIAVYNNVGWRVDYDDGDIQWIRELHDETKVRFLDGNGPPLTEFETDEGKEFDIDSTSKLQSLCREVRQNEDEGNNEDVDFDAHRAETERQQSYLDNFDASMAFSEENLISGETYRRAFEFEGDDDEDEFGFNEKVAPYDTDFETRMSRPFSLKGDQMATSSRLIGGAGSVRGSLMSHSPLATPTLAAPSLQQPRPPVTSLPLAEDNEDSAAVCTDDFEAAMHFGLSREGPHAAEIGHGEPLQASGRSQIDAYRDALSCGAAALPPPSSPTHWGGLHSQGKGVSEAEDSYQHLAEGKRRPYVAGMTKRDSKLVHFATKDPGAHGKPRSSASQSGRKMQRKIGNESLLPSAIAKTAKANGRGRKGGELTTAAGAARAETLRKNKKMSLAALFQDGFIRVRGAVSSVRVSGEIPGAKRVPTKGNAHVNVTNRSAGAVNTDDSEDQSRRFCVRVLFVEPHKTGDGNEPGRFFCTGGNSQRALPIMLRAKTMLTTTKSVLPSVIKSQRCGEESSDLEWRFQSQQQNGYRKAYEEGKIEGDIDIRGQDGRDAVQRDGSSALFMFEVPQCDAVKKVLAPLSSTSFHDSNCRTIQGRSGFEAEPLGHLLFVVYENCENSLRFRGQTIISLSEILSISSRGIFDSWIRLTSRDGGVVKAPFSDSSKLSLTTGVARAHILPRFASSYDWENFEIQLSVALELCDPETPLTAPLTPKQQPLLQDQEGMIPKNGREKQGKTMTASKKSNSALYTKRKDIEITHFAERRRIEQKKIMTENELIQKRINDERPDPKGRQPYLVDKRNKVRAAQRLRASELKFAGAGDDVGGAKQQLIDLQVETGDYCRQVNEHSRGKKKERLPQTLSEELELQAKKLTSLQIEVNQLERKAQHGKVLMGKNRTILAQLTRLATAAAEAQKSEAVRKAKQHARTEAEMKKWDEDEAALNETKLEVEEKTDPKEGGPEESGAIAAAVSGSHGGAPEEREEEEGYSDEEWDQEEAKSQSVKSPTKSLNEQHSKPSSPRKNSDIEVKLGMQVKDPAMLSFPIPTYEAETSEGNENMEDLAVKPNEFDQLEKNYAKLYHRRAKLVASIRSDKILFERGKAQVKATLAEYERVRKIQREEEAREVEQREQRSEIYVDDDSTTGEDPMHRVRRDLHQQLVAVEELRQQLAIITGGVAADLVENDGDTKENNDEVRGSRTDRYAEEISDLEKELVDGQEKLARKKDKLESKIAERNREREKYHQLLAADTERRLNRSAGSLARSLVRLMQRANGVRSGRNGAKIEAHERRTQEALKISDAERAGDSELHLTSPQRLSPAQRRALRREAVEKARLDSEA